MSTDAKIPTPKMRCNEAFCALAELIAAQQVLGAEPIRVARFKEMFEKSFDEILTQEDKCYSSIKLYTLARLIGHTADVLLEDMTPPEKQAVELIAQFIANDIQGGREI